MNDPVADMLTRIRNAIGNGRQRVRIKRTKVCIGVARVLKEEGYIKDFMLVDDANQGVIEVELKYGDLGELVIRDLRRVSKPGCRVYRGVDEFKRVCDGMGIAVVSTNRGVLSDRQCRSQRLGGEILCTVW